MVDTWNVDDFLTEYRPPEQVVQITMRGDLLGRLSSLEDELIDAKQQEESPMSLSIDDSLDAYNIAQEIQRLREQVRQSMRAFRVVSMGDGPWSDLIAKHPPRDDDRGPFHPDTFWPAATAASVVDPEMTEAQARKLLETLSSGQARKLLDAVTLANNGDDDLPKSVSGSVLRQHSKQKPITSVPEGSLDPSSMDG